MTEKWVDAVWEESLTCNVVATETKFDKFKCPPFYKLEITTSGLEGKDRENIISLIDENGKKYFVKYTLKSFELLKSWLIDIRVIEIPLYI